MRVLMIGDVVAKPGRVAVLERIQDLREQHRIDLAVMNAENVAGGFSITPTLADQLFSRGIDVMTSGLRFMVVSRLAEGRNSAWFATDFPC